MRNMRRMIGPALLIAGVIALVSTSAVAQRAERANARSSEVRASRSPKRITDRQRENANARVNLAIAIVNRFQAEASAKGLSPEWRRAALETLLPLSHAALERVEQTAHSLDSLAAVRAEAAEDPNLIGDPNADLTYTPIVPCRFIDTRNVGGKINGTVGFDTSTNGATYGGVAGCNPITVFGVVDDEQIGALAMNVTIVDPSSAPGFVAAKPTAAAPLTSLLNWYEAGPTVQAANLGIISTSQVTGTGVNFVIQSSAAVHVIVDFFGAFIEPEATALDVTTVSTVLDVAIGANFTLLATCPAGRTATGGGFNFTGGSDILEWWQNGPEGNGWRCRGDNDTPNIVEVTCFVRCGRVPGR